MLTTCEELYESSWRPEAGGRDHLSPKHPTVAEYCEKWLLMQSAKVSAATLKRIYLQI